MLLREPCGVQIVVVQLDLLHRDQVMVLAESEEATAPDDGILLARAIGQHFVDATQLPALAPEHRAIDEI